MTPENLDRERWEQAALDALERGGLAAVAVEPLARELGVTKGSFYWHFRTRQELIAGDRRALGAAPCRRPAQGGGHDRGSRERLLALLGKASAKPPSIFMRMLEASADDAAVHAAVVRAAELRVAFMAKAFGELGLSRARARRQALLAYSTYVGRAHLSRDAPELLGDPEALAKHAAEQLIP